MPLIKHRTSFSRFLSSKTFLFASLAVLSFLLFSFGREFANNYAIQREIAELTAEKESLAAQNSELTVLMSLVQTETYIEQEARIKLGLSKAGEKVVIFSEDDGVLLTDENRAVLSLGEDGFKADFSALANPRKWWYYFFNINKFDMIKVYGSSLSR